MTKRIFAPLWVIFVYFDEEAFSQKSVFEMNDPSPAIYSSKYGAEIAREPSAKAGLLS